MTNWNLFLAICFNLMLVTSAWTSVFWIKNRLTKTVAFIMVLAIYIYIFTLFAPKMGDVLMDNDIMGEMIARAWEPYLFFYIYYILFAFVVLISCLIYLIIQYLKKVNNK